MKSRLVRVLHWEGSAPAVGDRLRSRRGRYLITEVLTAKCRHCRRYTPCGVLGHPGGTAQTKPIAFRIVAITTGTVEGGREHPWTWARRGRNRGTPPAPTPAYDENRAG